ncbi:PaaI family thioesterase [Alcaligenaceae bacterium]|nr:PaaI family thioesterase [Alcaligenaceae bacterium]
MSRQHCRRSSRQWKRRGPGTTLEMKTQYVKAARHGKIQCCGEFVRRGRTISFLKATMTDEDGATIAFATSTWMQLKTSSEGNV